MESIHRGIIGMIKNPCDQKRDREKIAGFVREDDKFDLSSPLCSPLLRPQWARFLAGREQRLRNVCRSV